MKLTLAPGKIAVRKIEAKLKGGLELPVTRAKAFDLAEVTHVGRLDHYGFEGKESTTEQFNPGDIVLFQLPMNMALLASHKVKDVLTLFLNVGDIIARMDQPKDKDGRVVVDMKSFKIASRFLLIKPTVRKASTTIIIPDTAEEMNKESLHFSVLQKGPDVTIDVSIGQEIFPHRGRINPLVVDGEEVCFVDQQFVDGVMVEG